MKDLVEALRDLKESEVNELVEKKIAEGLSPLEIITACNDGMVAVGELFSQNKYFISQLIFSAEILKGVMKRLDPLMKGQAVAGADKKVVIGTVKGDIHDIGKNIVGTLLQGSGFEVVDLGVDVSADRFVTGIKQTGAKVLGMSALLNFTYPEMKNVVDTFIDAGLRDQVKIIIGGAPVNEQVREYAGADFYARDAVYGVKLCKEIYT
jgi:methanogenic corrinoid protein MtbC1